MQIAASLEIIAFRPVSGDKPHGSVYFMSLASLNKSDCPHPPTKPTPEVYGKILIFLAHVQVKEAMQ